MSKLEITIKKHPESLIIALSGSADMTEANTLKVQLEQILAESHNIVVIDLSKVNFISSMGLSTLVYAHRQCHQQGDILSLAGVQTAVEKVLKTTQLDQLFDMFDSVEAAITNAKKEKKA